MAKFKEKIQDGTINIPGLIVKNCTDLVYFYVSGIPKRKPDLKSICEGWSLHVRSDQ